MMTTRYDENARTEYYENERRNRRLIKLATANNEIYRKAKAYDRLQAIYGGTIHVDGKSVTIKDFLEGKDV